jgi:hypothetical protein
MGSRDARRLFTGPRLPDDPYRPACGGSEYHRPPADSVAKGSSGRPSKSDSDVTEAWIAKISDFGRQTRRAIILAAPLV